MLFVKATIEQLSNSNPVLCFFIAFTTAFSLVFLIKFIYNTILYYNKLLFKLSWAFSLKQRVCSFFKKINRQVQTRWWPRFCYLITDWVLTTNHRKLAILYFAFLGVTGFTGLVLATLIRLELAYPGQQLIANNAERYLTLVSVHGVVMVFFFVIPALFGAFGNYLIPLQLGIRDVAFPRLNSFMFWLTPGGFTLLLHLILFDRSHNVTYWVNYSATRSMLRRRYNSIMNTEQRIHENSAPSVMAWRLAGDPSLVREARNLVLSENAPHLKSKLSINVPTNITINSLLTTINQIFSQILSINISYQIINSYATTLIIFKRISQIITNYVASFINYFNNVTIWSLVLNINYNNALLNQIWLFNNSSNIFIKTYGNFSNTKPNIIDPTVNKLTSYTSWNYSSKTSTSIINKSLQTELDCLGRLNNNVISNNLNIQAKRRTTVSKQWLFTTYSNVNLGLKSINLIPLFGFNCWFNLIASYFTAYSNFINLIKHVSLFYNKININLFYLQSNYSNIYYYLNNNLNSNTNISVIWYNGFLYWISVWFQLFLRVKLNILFILKLSLSLYNLFDNIVLLYYSNVINFLTNLGVILYLWANRLQQLHLINYFIFSFKEIKYNITLWSIYKACFISFRNLTNLILLFKIKFELYNIYLSLIDNIIYNNINYLNLNSDNKLSTIVKTQNDNVNFSKYAMALSMRYAITKLQEKHNLLSLSVSFVNIQTPRVNAHLISLLTSHTWAAYDYLNDWRELRLEREVWRNTDALSLGRNVLKTRTHYYANFFTPARLTTKLSTWDSARLIPGWAFITPFTSRLRYTAVGKVDIALVVVFIATLGSVFSAVNYVITYRYIGAPLFKGRRELRPFFVDALLVASRMMLVANPALLIGIILLLSDRHFNTSVFDFSGGGDTILFQHLFWFFGHPEVYIIVIPCFGFVNALLPVYLRKRLSGRLSLQFSMYTIALMSFAVWGHHMYMVGLANSVRTLYSTVTVMISVPASTKVLHWCVTLIQATFVWDVGFLFLLNFIYFFVLGGLSGMMVAHIGFDTLAHDTVYVIAHFHTILSGGVVSCIFGAFYFYFASIFNVRYSRTFAYAHYTFYTVGQLVTLVPMFWLGYAGMPRRVFDYPTVYAGWHSLISAGHLLTVIGMLFFACMLLDSFSEGRVARNRTLGVGRLNTCLAFAAYEIRKLHFYQNAALRLPSPNLNKSELYKFCATLESRNLTYVFKKTK